MIILGSPTKKEIENRCGDWYIYKKKCKNFDYKGLSVTQLSIKMILDYPTLIDPIRLWIGSDQEIVKLLRKINPRKNNNCNLSILGIVFFEKK